MNNTGPSADSLEPIQHLSGHLARPRVTASNSSEYCHRLAEITARAVLSDPFNILLQQEKAGASTPTSLELLYHAALGRIETKIGLGSSVVEADGFAAVACWEPPSATRQNYTETLLDELAKERPIYARFIRDLGSKTGMPRRGTEVLATLTDGSGPRQSV
jgi:hypothetical protein